MPKVVDTAGTARVNTPAWISCTDAARRAEVTSDSIHRWCQVGWITGKKVGGRWRIDPASLDSLLAGNRPDLKP